MTKQRWPAALEATGAAIRSATSAIKAMPSSTVQALAAGSAGLGAGLYLGGAPRLIAAAGMAPAVVLGAAALSRTAPLDPRRAGDPAAERMYEEDRLDDDGGPAEERPVREKPARRVPRSAQG